MVDCPLFVSLEFGAFVKPLSEITSLQDLLQAFPAMSPAEFSRYLARFESEGFRAREEARLFCRVWGEYCRALREGGGEISFLHPLVSVFQFPAVEEIREQLIQSAIPDLRELFRVGIHERYPEFADDWLFPLKILAALTSPRDSGEVVSQVIRSGFGGESFVWGVIFDQVGDDPDWCRFLWNSCSEDPPDLFCGICFLDLANQLSNEVTGGSEFGIHPFRGAKGVALLEEWLESDDPGDESYAMSAAEALTFLSEGDRRHLLGIAREHDSEEVRLRAASCLLKEDESGGIELLRELCLNPATTGRATEMLERLGKFKEIPVEVSVPEFRALAEFCDWLRNPENFGEIADEIDCIGRERLYWPPAGAERELYLFRYVYHSECHEGSAPDEVGVGVVGSRTVSLVGQTSATMSFREILALHCCWELQQNGDPSAPALLSIEEGLKLLDRT